MKDLAGVLGACEMLAKSEVVPERIRGDVGAVLGLWLAGEELGVGVMSAIQHVQLVGPKGRATLRLSSRLMWTLALREGHRIEVVEASKDRCVVEGQRAGTDRVHTVAWTLDDAKKKGLLSRPGPWTQWSDQMLKWRAITDMVKLVAPEVGLAAAQEQDEIAREMAENEASDESLPPAGPEGEGTEDSAITKDQVLELKSLRDQGMSRERLSALASDITDGRVQAARDLLEGEAQEVISLARSEMLARRRAKKTQGAYGAARELLPDDRPDPEDITELRGDDSDHSELAKYWSDRLPLVSHQERLALSDEDAS